MEPGFSSAPHPSWIFDTWRMAHTHIYTTHTCSQPEPLSTLTNIRTAHAHTKWQLGLQVYTPSYTTTHTSICMHTWLKLSTILRRQVAPPNLKWQPPVIYIKSQCKRYLLIETLCRKSRYRCTTSSYLYQLGVKNLAICPSVIAPGLLKKKMNKMRRRQYQEHRL